MILTKPLRRTLSYAGLILLLFAGVQGYALFFLGPVLASQLNQRLQKASKGVYLIKQKSASLNLLSGSLVLIDFSLTADSSRYQDLLLRGEIKGNLYDVSIPRLQLSGVGVYEAFSSENLEISRLLIEQPKVKVVSQTLREPDTLKVGNLYDLTEGSFTSLNVGELEIREGQLHMKNNRAFGKNAFQVRDVSIRIKNLQIDSSAQFNLDRSFYAEEIEVGADVVDYSFVTPDSTYEIAIGQLGLSTSKQEFFAENIRVRPRYDHFLDLRMEGEPLPWLAELRIPRLAFEGLDLHGVFFDRELLLNRIHLQQPGIRLIGSGRTARLEEGVELPALYPLVKDILKRIQVEEIEVENAGLDVEKNLEDPRRAAAIRGINLQLLAFEIDSTVRDLPFRAQDMRLEVRDYGLWLAGDDYLLQGQNLWLSTQSRFMLSDSMRLIPSQAVYQAARQGWGRKPDVYEAFIPSLMVEGVDIRQLYFTRELEVNKIYMGGPELWLTNFPQVKKEKVDALVRSNFYKLIEGMLYVLAIRDLEIEEGVFHFNDQNQSHSNTFTAKDISVNVLNFRVDSLAQKKTDNPFYADDIDINFDLANYSLLLPDSSHRVTIGRLGFSAGDSSVYGGDILFQPTSFALALPDSVKPALYKMYLPSLGLKGLDAQRLYFENKISVRTVSLDSPEFAIHTYRKQKDAGLAMLDSLPLLLTNNFESVKIDYLEVNEATFSQSHHDSTRPSHMHLPHLSAWVRHFYVDSTSRMDESHFGFAEDIRLRLQHFSQKLKDDLYRLSLGDIRYSTASGELQIDSARLYAIGIESRRRVSQEGGALLDAFVPRIRFTGIVPYAVFRHRLFALDSVEAVRPVITLTHYPLEGQSISDTLPRPDVYAWVSPYVDLFSVNGVAVRNGIFRYRNGRLGPEKDFNVRDISMGIANLKVDSLVDAPFFAEDISVGLNVNEYSFLLPDSSYEVRAGRIEVSTGGSFITVDSIRLLPQRPEGQAARILIPQIQLEGLSFPDLYLNREVEVAALRFVRPHIRMQQPLDFSPTAGEPLTLPDLYQKISGQLRRLYIGRVEVRQGSFLAMSGSKGPIKVPEFDAVLENFRVDSLSGKRIRQFFYAEEMQLSFLDLEYTLPDSMYDMGIKSAQISSCDRRIRIDSLMLIPRYGLYDFGRELGYSLDRVELLVPEIRVEGFNAWAAANQQRFLARRLIVDKFNVKTFRDRRLPNPTDRKPLLLPEVLSHAPFAFHLDTLIVLNGRTVYQERAAESPEVGWISFGDIFATITPVSNDTLLYQRREEMVMNARCKLMDQGLLRVKLSFPLGDTTASHSYSGILEPMDMAAINTITEPAVSVKIRSGRVDKLYFNVEANRYASKGRMRFYYHDFRVQVLNKKKGNKKGIESFLANSFLVRTHNPSRRFVRIGQIEFERDMSKSMFNFFYKTMLSGIASSIGMKKKKDRIKNSLLSPTPEIQ